jgi:hypothetical protein
LIDAGGVIDEMYESKKVAAKNEKKAAAKSKKKIVKDDE